MDDAALLHAYVRERDEAAFSELVRRHVDLVHTAAFRRVGGDARKAQEVTQQVFIDLAKKAAALTRHPALPAWLHRSTRFVAANLRREEHRRRAREEISARETDTVSASPFEPAADWTQLAPVLDAALDTLGETDRQVVVLRHFSQLSFAEIGATLRVSEAAAQMRAARALEKLRRALQKRGVTSTASALGLALGANTVTAAPAGIATSTLAAVSATGSVAAAGAGAGLFTVITSSTKLTLGTVAALSITVGTGWVVLSSRTPPAFTDPVPITTSAAPPATSTAATTLAQPTLPPPSSQKASVLAQATPLHPQPTESTTVASAATAPSGRFEIWGADALQAVRAAEDALNEKLKATGLGSTNGWDQEMQRMELEIEFEHALASALTTEQFNDYIRRKSVTARVLEKPLTAFAASDAEAEAIFQIERDFGLRWGAYGSRPRGNPAWLAEWQAARESTNNRLRESLGPVRYEEWLAARAQTR
jgi:RNA polymerase sigma factor (sigma-70 family)